MANITRQKPTNRHRLAQEKMPEKARRMAYGEDKMEMDNKARMLIDSFKGPVDRLLWLMCEAIAEQAKNGQEASMAIKELIEEVEAKAVEEKN